MWQRNNGQSEAEKLQNRFTSYLVTAVNMAKEYPTVKEATSEIVNLTAICSLPKGTEYFFSDLHGEYEAFIHLLRSSSGITREKIKETFGHLIPEEDSQKAASRLRPTVRKHTVPIRNWVKTRLASCSLASRSSLCPRASKRR